MNTQLGGVSSPFTSLEAFLDLMRQVPTPVTVVTAHAGLNKIRGMTAGSFTSVSLDPLLVSVNVLKDSQMHGVLAQAMHFAVHILAQDQAHWSEHFAIPDLTGTKQFETFPHHINTHGIPILKETLGIVHCQKYALYEAGDHSIVLGEVLSVEKDRSGRPLIYYGRGYHGLSDMVFEVER